MIVKIQRNLIAAEQCNRKRIKSERKDTCSKNLAPFKQRPFLLALDLLVTRDVSIRGSIHCSDVVVATRSPHPASLFLWKRFCCEAVSGELSCTASSVGWRNGRSQCGLCYCCVSRREALSYRHGKRNLRLDMSTVSASDLEYLSSSGKRIFLLF